MKTSTGATPFSLVYGTEVVLPIEVEIKSLRVIVEADLPEVKWVEQSLVQLNLIDSESTLLHSTVSEKSHKTFR